MSGDHENGFDSTSSRTRKRMLPSVAEVAQELSRRTAADAASIQTVSRKVCAAELVRVKEGEESAAVEVLVERAWLLLEQEARPPLEIFPFEPPPPPAPVLPAPPAGPLPEGADPFGETSGRLDLRWEADALAPTEDQGGEIPPPETAPFEVSSPLPDAPPGGEPAAEPGPAAPPPPFAVVLDEPIVPARAEAPLPPLKPPPARTSPLPLLLAAALLVLVAGGGAWYLISGPSKPAGPPPPLAEKREAAAAAPATVVPVTTAVAPIPPPPQPTAVPVEKAVPASPKQGEKREPAAAQVQLRAGPLVTPDWTGAPIHVIHFSSFTEKARSEKHAALLAKQLGLPARAVQVDLGEKGLWYRAVVGEFATAEEALAYRTQLLEKGTPGVGLVYRMTQKK